MKIRMSVDTRFALRGDLLHVLCQTRTAGGMALYIVEQAGVRRAVPVILAEVVRE